MATKLIEVFVCEETGKEFLKEKEYLANNKKLQEQNKEKDSRKNKEKELQALFKKAGTLQEFLDGVSIIGNKCNPLKSYSNKKVEMRLFAEDISFHIEKNVEDSYIDFNIITVAESDFSGFSSSFIEETLGWSRRESMLRTGGGGYRGKEYKDFSGYVCRYSATCKIKDLPNIRKKIERYVSVTKSKKNWESEIAVSHDEKLKENIQISVWNKEAIDRNEEISELKNKISDLEHKQKEIYIKINDYSSKIRKELIDDCPFPESEQLLKLQKMMPNISMKENLLF